MQQITNIATKVEQAKKFIAEAIEKHGDKIAVSCSFGKDSIVLLHLARQVKPDIAVFSVLTRFKPKETFEYKDQIQKLWNLNLTVYQSDAEIEPNLHITNPDLCCKMLKVEPTKQALKNYDAWFAGLRRTEGRTRTDYEETQHNGSLIKYNPIIDWTELDIWKYIAINQIPTHPWYKLGYRSLGCACCTKLVDDSETERAGRWIGTSKCGGECGIHTQILK
ncbi:MAG: phosphoadenylyl-sulfate reductase [Patescibacteria group bacterium]